MAAFANKTTHTDRRHAHITTTNCAHQRKDRGSSLQHTITSNTKISLPASTALANIPPWPNDSKGKITNSSLSRKDSEQRQAAVNYNNNRIMKYGTVQIPMLEHLSNVQRRRLARANQTTNTLRRVRFDPSVQHPSRDNKTHHARDSPLRAVANTATHTQRMRNTTNTDAPSLPYPRPSPQTTRLGATGLQLARSGLHTTPENAHNAHRQGESHSPRSVQPLPQSDMLTQPDKARRAQALWDAHYNLHPKPTHPAPLGHKTLVPVTPCMALPPHEQNGSRDEGIQQLAKRSGHGDGLDPPHTIDGDTLFTGKDKNLLKKLNKQRRLQAQTVQDPCTQWTTSRGEFFEADVPIGPRSCTPRGRSTPRMVDIRMSHDDR